MKTLEHEHKKYFVKFGVSHGTTVDCRQEARKPMARCSICVERYGGAPKQDGLILETRHGRDYLCCRAHRRKSYAE